MKTTAFVSTAVLLATGCVNTGVERSRPHPFVCGEIPVAYAEWQGVRRPALTEGLDLHTSDAVLDTASADTWHELLAHSSVPADLRAGTESLLQALLVKMDVHAWNAAHADVIGFKGTRVFIENRPLTANQPAASSSENALPTAGERPLVARKEILFKQGAAIKTGVALDGMIQGDGFFQVELPGGGTGYTRAGDFVCKDSGELVLGNSDGYRLKDAPTIPDDVPRDKVGITSDGRIVAQRADGAMHDLGQLTLARFANPGGLRQLSANVFAATQESGPPLLGRPGENGLGLILPGCLECSNSDGLGELAALKAVHARFQATLVMLRLVATEGGTDDQTRR